MEDLLLPAVAALIVDFGSSAPEYDFAWRHAVGWLSALERLAPAALRDQSVLVLDATVPNEFDVIHVHALELVLRRCGLRTMSLSATVDPARLGRASRALAPAAVVITGRRAPLDQTGKLVHAVRRVAPQTVICDYRGAVPDTGASTVYRLGDSVLTARDRLLERLDSPARPAAAPVAARSGSARSA